jgi:predicted nucleotidyltransferase
LAPYLESETMTSHAVNHAIVQQLREAFAHDDTDLVCVYLYGSLARGQGHPGSDVDIAVLYATEPPSTLDGLGVELANALEQHLGRAVDLVVLNRAPVDLIHRVLRDGILIHDRDPAARIRFEVKARNEYFDLLPYLRQYRRSTRGASL